MSKVKSVEAGVSLLGIVNVGADEAGENKVLFGKALQVALVDFTEYLACVMYKEACCNGAYEVKERDRRAEK